MNLVFSTNEEKYELILTTDEKLSLLDVINSIH